MNAPATAGFPPVTTAPTTSQALSEDWAAALSSWTAHLRAAGRPATTIRTRTQHLNQLRAETGQGPFDLTTADLVEWLASHEWTPASMYAARSSLRGFYSWAHRAGLTPTDPACNLPQVKRRPPAPHPLPDSPLRAALENAAPRERLMIDLAARVGLRRGEVARVHSRDVTLDEDGWTLRVNGKGGRERVLPIPADIADRILARAPGWCFPGNDHGHLSPLWVGHLISELLPPGWSMHALRHRFATRAYRATKDAYAVQRLLGHASPNTTLTYVQIADETLRRAMESAA